MFAQKKTTILIALLVACVAISSSEAMFGKKKDKHQQVVTQYVPVPQPSYGGEHSHQGHGGHHFGHHHDHHDQHHGGHHSGHHGGASAASASASAGGSASASASAGGSASASASGAGYYPEPHHGGHHNFGHDSYGHDSHHEPHGFGLGYEPNVKHHGLFGHHKHGHHSGGGSSYGYQQPMVQNPGAACVAPCYGGLIGQSIPFVQAPTAKPKRGLFGKKKHQPQPQQPLIIQQQYLPGY